VLLFSSYIIQQKERLCIKKMNLYFHHISASRWQEAFAEFWQPKYGNAHQKASLP